MATSLPDLNQLAAQVGAAARAAQIDHRQRDALLGLLLEFAHALLEQHEFVDASNASADAVRLASELIDEGRGELIVQLGAAMRCHADALLELGRAERAIEVYASTTGLLAELAGADARVEPEWASALLNYGEALRCCGRVDQALPVLEQALELFDDDAGRVRATLARGKTLAELGRTHESLEASAAALDLARGLDEASLAHALDAHAELLRSLGRVDQALDPAEQAVELIARLAQHDPIRYLHPLARMTNNLARVYQQAQQLERAVALFEHALSGFRILAQARPHAHGVTLIQVMSNLALALAQMAQLERAHGVAAEVLQLAEREPGWGLLPLITGTRQLAADLALDLGRPDEAREHLLAGMRLLQEAIAEQQPGASEAAARLGASLRELCAAQGFSVPDDLAALLGCSQR